MEKKSANWIAFYSRHGEQESLPFYSAERPTLASVVSKIKKRHAMADYVLPYAPEGATPELKAQAFLKVNSIEGLVFTPFIEKRQSLRS